MHCNVCDLTSKTSAIFAMLIRRVFHVRKIQLLQFQRNHSSRNVLHLRDRGMLQDVFPKEAVGEIKDVLNSKPQCVYAGFDPTAQSLHVGNLLVLVNLLHWQRGGHKVIAVLGGATGRIGDPSGRNTEREKLSSTFIDDNLAGIRRNIETIFSNHERFLWSEEDRKLGSLIIVNNEDWYNTLTPVELLGNAGRHLRMGTLLSRSSVESRLQSPAGMSLTEFSYQLFQAYDWFHLYRQYGCRFQIGGGDQMGNIMSGHELIGKMCHKAVYGLTLPLITTEMGDKFGKSAGNAVWLSANDTMPFTFYQFWIRTADGDVEKMLKLFTFDTVGAVEDLMCRHRAKPDQRLAQKYLAEKVTLLVHGEDGLRSAQRASKALYAGNVEGLAEMTVTDIAKLFGGATVQEVLPQAGMTVLDLALKRKCFPTKDDAIRIISAGGFYINNQRANNPNEVVNPGVHVLSNKVSLLRVGKKNYYIVKWT